MVAFCRIDDHEIRTHEPIAHPDVLIVQDATLLHQVDVFNGLGADGYLLINTERSFDELGLGEFVTRFRRERLLTVPASELAQEHLGRPLPGAPLLGGFAALSGLISIDSVAASIREKFPGRVAEGNVAAARGRLRAGARRDRSAERCLGRWRDPAPSRRRSRSAGPR